MFYSTAGGYTSFPGMGTTADPIGGGPGGYQGPPFSQGPRPGTKNRILDGVILGCDV